MASFNATPALRNAWYTANTTRLNDNPELGSAVQAAGVDYATARRLDMSFQAMKASQQKGLVTDSGSSNQMVPSQLTVPAASADVAADQKKQADQQAAANSGGGGFWGGVGNFFSGIGNWITGEGLQQNSPIAKKVAPVGAQAADQAGLTSPATPGSGLLPAQWANDINAGASHVIDYGTKALNVLASPLMSPEAAGSADKPMWEQGLTAAMGNNSMGALGPLGALALGTIDYGRGVGKEAVGVDPQQAQDMRNQGYNPDSWLSRYNYYGDYSQSHPVISNTVVDKAKQQYNPLKVDMVREILTSGALGSYDRTAGLSPNAQQVLQNIQANHDPEASAIMAKLADQSAVSLGGHLADQMGLEEGTTERQLVSMAGDMAGYWFLDPMMVAGKASNALKMARFGTQMDTDSVKAAIMEKSTLSSRWDDILDRVDHIHVLTSSPKVEDQAKGASALNDFQTRYPDLTGVYPLLAGMRSGAVHGALFEAPKAVAKSADMTPVLGIKYAEKPEDYRPVWQLRDAPGQQVDQGTRDAARAKVAEQISDALVANAVTEGRPVVSSQVLLPGQLRVTTPVRKALNGVTDALLGTGSGKRGMLFQQLKDAENKGVLDWDDAENASTAVSHVIDTGAGGQWVNEHYTRGGLRANAAMALSRFRKLRDAAPVSFTDPSGFSAYQGLVRFIMPKGQAALMAQRWAVSDPATRSAMWNQLADTMANARHARDTQAGSDFWRQSLKGREQVTPKGQRALEAYSSPDTDLISTPSGNMAAAMYSTQFAEGARVPSLVDIVRNTQAVGVLSWLTRVSHGRLSTIYSKLGKVGQVGTTSNMAKQVIEGKALQGLEDPAGLARVTAARIGLSADTAESRVAINEAIRQARAVLKSGDMQHLTPLAVQGDNASYIAQVENTLSKKGQALNPVLRDLLEKMDLTDGPNHGIITIASGRSAARLAATKVVDPLRTWRAHVVKALGIGTRYTSPFAYDWLSRADDGFYNDLTDGVERLLGDQRGAYATGGAVEDMAQVHGALDAGNRFAKVGLRNTQGYLGSAGDIGAQRWGNALGYRLGDPVGSKVHEAVAHHELQVDTHRTEFEQAKDALAKSKLRRLTSDEAGVVHRAVLSGHDAPEGHFAPLVKRWALKDAEADPEYAGHIEEGKSARAAIDDVQESMDDLRRQRRQKGADKAAIDAELSDLRDELKGHVADANTHDAAATDLYENRHLAPMVGATQNFHEPRDVAEWLLKNRPEGQRYRLEGRRGMYVGGKYAETDADRDAALSGWSDQMTEDAVRYLGLRTDDTSPGQRLVEAKKSLLTTVANGERPEVDALAKVPNRLRPEQVQAPVIVGKQAVDPKQQLGDWLGGKASQAYELFVGGPIRRLLHDPQTAAAKWEAMTAMAPLAENLTERGMSADNAYKVLDTLAAKHAIARVARYSDNPHATTYFAALSNNFLWYERAMEDFARRAINVVKSDPAVLARAHVMWESAQHSGVVYRQQGTDDDGNPQTQWMFTWPGSGLAMKAINEASQSLGLSDGNLVKTPVWQDFASPVTYLSPSLSNPIGFSTNPMLGIPLRAVRDVFPQTSTGVNDWLTALEGGVRGFASSGQGTGVSGFLGDVGSELAPVYLQRTLNALNPDDRDGETASALKNALIYMDAAGKLPGPDASADDRQRALDELRQQTQNGIIFRAALASFLPATPGTMSTDVDDLGKVDEFDQLRGVNSIRSEWFQLLEDMTAKYGSDRAMSEASTEWLQRDLGSIVHPEDFTVGTSGAPGDDTGNSFASSQNLVQWMLDNNGFLKEYGQAAYKLLPSMPGDTYYNQIGYQTQLRTGLRQHKDSTEMYNALIKAQGDRSYYAALDSKDDAITQNPAQSQAIYNQFDQYITNLKTANPVWSADETSAPDKVYTEIAPSVEKMANATDLPEQLKPLQPQIQLMATLYDDYRSSVAKYPSSSAVDVEGRSHIESQYRKMGDSLFKGSQLNDLWSAMKVYED